MQHSIEWNLGTEIKSKTLGSTLEAEARMAGASARLTRQDADPGHAVVEIDGPAEAVHEAFRHISYVLQGYFRAGGKGYELRPECDLCAEAEAEERAAEIEANIEAAEQGVGRALETGDVERMQDAVTRWKEAIEARG